MKKLLILIAIFALTACSSLYEKEATKTTKHNSTSGRINSSSENTKDVLKDLDD